MSNRPALSIVLAAVTGALASACGGNTVIDASSYRTSCVEQRDCAPAFIGETCRNVDNPCLCSNFGISGDDFARFQTDRIEALQACSTPLADECFFTCGSFNAVDCIDGTCTLIK